MENGRPRPFGRAATPGIHRFFLPNAEGSYPAHGLALVAAEGLSKLRHVGDDIVDPVFVQRMWITKSIGAITKHRLTRMFRSKSKGQPESYPFTFQYCLRLIVLTMRAGAA